MGLGAGGHLAFGRKVSDLSLPFPSRRCPPPRLLLGVFVLLVPAASPEPGNVHGMLRDAGEGSAFLRTQGPIPPPCPDAPHRLGASSQQEWGLESPLEQMLRPVVIPEAGADCFNGHITCGSRARGVPCAPSHQGPGMLGK